MLFFFNANVPVPGSNVISVYSELIRRTSSGRASRDLWKSRKRIENGGESELRFCGSVIISLCWKKNSLIKASGPCQVEKKVRCREQVPVWRRWERSLKRTFLIKIKHSGPFGRQLTWKKPTLAFFFLDSTTDKAGSCASYPTIGKLCLTGRLRCALSL